MELLVVFLIIFVIYGAGWLWEALSGLLRPPPLGVVSDPPLRVPGPGNARVNVDEAFRIFAEGRGGSVRRGARGDGPRASFVHNGARAELTTPALRGALRGFHTLLSIETPA